MSTYADFLRKNHSKCRLMPTFCEKIIQNVDLCRLFAKKYSKCRLMPTFCEKIIQNVALCEKVTLKSRSLSLSVFCFVLLCLNSHVTFSLRAMEVLFNICGIPEDAPSHSVRNICKGRNICDGSFRCSPLTPHNHRLFGRPLHCAVLS